MPQLHYSNRNSSPCHAPQCHTIPHSHHATPYLTPTCHTIPHPTMPHHTSPHHATPYFTPPCDTIPHPTMPFPRVSPSPFPPGRVTTLPRRPRRRLSWPIRSTGRPFRCTHVLGVPLHVCLYTCVGTRVTRNTACVHASQYCLGACTA